MFLLSVELWLLSFATARAGTFFLTPSADTTLMERFPDNNLGGQEFFNSGTTQNYTTNRGLLKFDLAAQVPANALITGVTLTLDVVKQPVDGFTPSNFALHRMLRDWGEGNQSGNPPVLGAPARFGEANWTHRFALTSEEWAAPGGVAEIDFAAAASGESYIYGLDFSPYTFASTPAMLADAQGWLADPAGNFGWMLLTQDETGNFTARRFASSEDPFRAPLLMVEFTVVPEPSALALFGVGGGLVLLWRLRPLSDLARGRGRK